MSAAKVLFPNDEEIYRILKGLPNADKLQDKIWESFCLENEALQNEKKSPAKRRFKKHPSNFQIKKDNCEEEDCSSDGLAEALFGHLKSTKSKNRCDSEVVSHQEDDYDSLDEYCDVTFRKIGSVHHKVKIEEVKSADAIKNVVPSAVRCKSVNKQMTKVILKEAIVEPDNQLEVETASVSYDMNKDRRLRTVLQKCNNSMDDIRLLIDIGIPQPDGEEDYLRRKKRSVEFASRFSRIYLYELNRLINDIRKLLRPHTTQRALHASCVKMTLSSRTNVTQKFVQTLQLVQQSLVAYYNHLPTSILIGTPEKLKDLLNVCVTIGQLQQVVVSGPGDTGAGEGDADNVFTPFNTRSKSLLDRINECCQIESKTSLLKSDRSKFSLLGYNIAKSRGTGDVSSKTQLTANSGRFSMYGGGGMGHGCRKDAYWRNAIATLGKKHFNVTSRYKTAKFKHRPDLAEQRADESPPRHQSFQAFPILPPNPTPKGAHRHLSTDGGATGAEKCSATHAVGGVEGEEGGEGERRRVRRRRQGYSLNDDNVTTQMQNVGEGDAEEEGEGEGSCGGGGGELQLSRRRRRSRGKEHVKGDTHYHHKAPIPPHPPHSSPQLTPHHHHHHHSTNEFLGDSSQCDLAPPTPTPKHTPPAPASTTTNTPKSSRCQLHTPTTTTKYPPTKQLLTCADEHAAYEPCAACHECQRQRVGADAQPHSGGTTRLRSVVEENWSRLRGDCDRTLRRLDERMGGEVGDERGVKRDMAKKLAGLVKKSVVMMADDDAAISERDKRSDKVTVTSVTGAKNAKLICIRDDNSLIHDTLPPDITENAAHKPTTNRPPTRTHSQTQTDISACAQQPLDAAQKRRKNVKISRLPQTKVRRPLRMLNKETSLNVIRYKLDYHKAKKQNPIYQKAVTGVQPWTLMEKVSDGILDHLLLSVAREIQVDDILVKLYESEFYAV